MTELIQCPRCKYRSQIKDDVLIHIKAADDDAHAGLSDAVDAAEWRRDALPIPSFSVDPNLPLPSRGHYLFPVRTTGGDSEFLPHAAADKPTKLTIENTDEVPEEVTPFLETLYPDKEIDAADLITEKLLDPVEGVLIGRRYSRPHAVVGYHEGPFVFG